MRNLTWLETILVRGTTAVLIFVVFVGAMCPPLYEGVLPHDHLFFGGPPPANWEQHHHDNPLGALFGGNASDVAPPTAEPAIQTTVDVAPARTGKVVSLYAAPSVLVLSVVALAMLLPAALLVSLPTTRGIVRIGAPVLFSAEPAAPLPPPPRRHIS